MNESGYAEILVSSMYTTLNECVSFDHEKNMRCWQKEPVFQVNCNMQSDVSIYMRTSPATTTWETAAITEAAISNQQISSLVADVVNIVVFD